MDIFVDNRLRIPVEKSSWPWIKHIRDKFIHRNPDYHKQKNMGIFRPTASQYLATTWWDDPGRTVLSLPRGGLSELLGNLRAKRVDAVLHDQMIVGGPVEYHQADGWELRPYQEEAVRQIMKWETCLIQGAPGSGKTEILLGAIAQAGLKTLVIVPDGRIFDQWVERAQVRLGLRKSEIGTVGNRHKYKIGDRLTIATQQTAWRRFGELAQLFGFIGIDEVHKAAARTYVEVIDAFPARFRVGISARIKRQDLRHFLTHDLFGPIVYDISGQDLEDLGYLEAVECVVVPTNFSYDYMNKGRIEMACKELELDPSKLKARDRRRLERKFEINRRDFGEYCTAAAMDIGRNRLIAGYVMEEVEQGNRCLLFTNRREHCEIWKKGLEARGVEVAIFWGAASKAEDRKIKADLARLQKGEILVGIGTVVDEGIDLPAVEAGFVCQRTAQHPGKLQQQAGRLARIFEGKAGARFYYFWDQKIPQFKKDLGILQKRFRKVRVIGWPTES